MPQLVFSSNLSFPPFALFLCLKLAPLLNTLVTEANRTLCLLNMMSMWGWLYGYGGELIDEFPLELCLRPPRVAFQGKELLL